MLPPTFHMALLLGIAGLILLLVTVRPDEQRWMRVGLCLAVGATVLLYLDWHTGLLMAASPHDIRGSVWVWGFYLFEGAAFGEFCVIFLQLMWLTARPPKADRYERLWRARAPATLPAVDA